ncbi:GtrA family protein [bacterium]|nr:GtrA family protein [bacterium]
MNCLKKLYEKWLKIDDKIRFIFIGGVNAAISYVIFVILILIFGEAHHQLCVTGQWVLSSFTSYLNQKFFVFNTRGNYIKEYIKCCMTWVVSYILNLIVLEILLKFLIKNVYIAQLLSIFIVSVVTYVLFKYFAFKVKK